MMEIICSWCGKHCGEKPGPDGLVTHTICPDCLRKLEDEADGT